MSASVIDVDFLNMRKKDKEKIFEKEMEEFLHLETNLQMERLWIVASKISSLSALIG